MTEERIVDLLEQILRRIDDMVPRCRICNFNPRATQDHMCAECRKRELNARIRHFMGGSR